jgi:hypothetical protein
MAELSSNKAVEDAAIAWVMELERRAGREPRDTRHSGAPADIESPPRLIEIKAFGRTNRGYDLWFEPRQVEEARRNPHFYVYVVENVRQGEPSLFTLKVLSEKRLQGLLARAKEQRYYTVPWPVADYDTAPTTLGEGLDAQAPAPEAQPEARQEAESDAVDWILFRSMEQEYIEWLGRHPRGFVVNAQRNPKPGYLQLHRAWCKWIYDAGKAPGAYTERAYIKVCAPTREPLERWARELDGQLGTRCSCPPR